MSSFGSHLLILKFLPIILLTEARIFCKLRFYVKNTCAKKTFYPILSIKSERGEKE